jgi:ribosome biogenesis GTPase / thiamine phosphate phosphatase
MTPNLEQLQKHGQIIREYGQTLLVEVAGEVYECFSRKNIDAITVGDYVIIEFSENPTTKPVIIERLARTSILMRRDRYHPQKELAANLTQVMIVLAVMPTTAEIYLDQYLCAAELAGLKAIIVLNKIDLLNSEHSTEFSALEYYQNIGYPLIKISVSQQQNIAALTQHLSAQATLMLGVSGVGKSSLINLLVGSDARTGIISAANQKGQHTTSTCTLYHLPFGGELLDAPGIREFNLVTEKDQIIQGFREFKPYLGQCKFRNCQHIHEPHCALKEAVDSGAISAQRFKNYFRILAG